MNYTSVLSDCWALGASYLPLCGLPTWATAFLPGFGGEIIPVGHRRFRVLRKLGEGGYAVVLLVTEVASEQRPHPDPEPRALKKVLVQSGDHFDAVQQEMLIHSTVQHHPHILALLDYCCSEGDQPPQLPPPAAPSPGSNAAATPPQQRLHTLPQHPIAASMPASPQPPVGASNGPAACAVGSPLAATKSEPGTAGVGRSWNPDDDSAGARRLGGPLRGATRFAAAPAAAGAGDAGGAGFGAVAMDMRGSACDSGGGGAVAGSAGGCGNRMACFLFPVFADGTLAMELDRLRERGEMLPTREVLSMIGQIARAAAHVHAHGYAHRDIKPLNILISTNPAYRPQAPSAGSPPQRPPGRQPPGLPQPQTLAQRTQQPRRAQQAGASGLAPLSAPGGTGGEQDVEAGEGLLAGGPAEVASGQRYHCVLMDFGSARLRGVELASRSQALRLQEDAEAHCSAPYRAPELFDAPSPASLDLAACDVWALGATLFHVMYGEPPFQRAMNTAGGSLALAVLNCAIGWPRAGAPAYPPELHDLVLSAMAAETGDRPSAQRLAEMADELAQRSLPNP